MAVNDYYQRIVMPNEDGKTGIVFDGSKASSFSRLNMVLDAKEKADMFYVFPLPKSEEKYDVDTSNYLLTMPIGGYTDIRKFDLTESLSYKGDTFIYKTNARPMPDGHYGMWMNPGNYNMFSYAWVFPSSLQPVYYHCNRKGKWIKNENMIHFVAESGQNDFLFEIHYVRSFKIPTTLEGRKVNFVETMTVHSDTIQVLVSDPDLEDGDIISLNVNGEWKLRNFVLMNAPAKFTFSLGEHKESYIAMHAENLGGVPPNTGMLTILDGKVRKEIVLNSDMGVTQGIILKRE